MIHETCAMPNPVLEISKSVHLFHSRNTKCCPPRAVGVKSRHRLTLNAHSGADSSHKHERSLLQIPDCKMSGPTVMGCAVSWKAEAARSELSCNRTSAIRVRGNFFPQTPEGKS
jgi:hypothetical protein